MILMLKERITFLNLLQLRSDANFNQITSLSPFPEFIYWAFYKKIKFKWLLLLLLLLFLLLLLCCLIWCNCFDTFFILAMWHFNMTLMKHVWLNCDILWHFRLFRYLFLIYLYTFRLNLARSIQLFNRSGSTTQTMMIKSKKVLLLSKLLGKQRKKKEPK